MNYSLSSRSSTKIGEIEQTKLNQVLQLQFVNDVKTLFHLILYFIINKTQT